MVQIQSTCSTCRADLDLTPADVVLLLPEEVDERPLVAAGSDDDGEDAQPRGPRLVHDCPQCGQTTVRVVEWRLARLLIAHGVAGLPDLELEPAVEPHPENPPTGPELTVDAVIELHDLLERADWFDALVAAGPAA